LSDPPASYLKEFAVNPECTSASPADRFPTVRPRRLALATLALLAGLAACETGTKLSSQAPLAPVESRTPVTSAGSPSPGAAGTAAAAAAMAAQSSVATVDLAARSAGAGAAVAAGSSVLALAPSQRVVFFDFDSFVIKDDFKPLLEAHAKVLAAQRGKRMVVEGHTDERGGREYNLALGQKRAEAVLRSMALLGVPEGALEAVSFGQERPLAQGSDESAWARNRRAELKDR